MTLLTQLPGGGKLKQDKSKTQQKLELCNNVTEFDLPLENRTI